MLPVLDKETASGMFSKTGRQTFESFKIIRMMQAQENRGGEEKRCKMVEDIEILVFGE